MLISRTFLKYAFLRTTVLVGSIALAACQAGFNQPNKGGSNSGASGNNDTRPNAPIVSAVSGSNPDHNLHPYITGTSDANTFVYMYSTSNCTGSVIGSGTAAEFSTTGIQINVTSNSTTTVYATARSASNVTSVCSSTSVTYVDDSTAPVAPTAWAMSSPADTSTSNDTTPAISGSAAETNAIVKVYPSSSCTPAQLLGSGTVAAGAFSISAFTLTGDGAKSFYYTIEDTFGNITSCATTSLSYTLDTVAPTVTVNQGGSQPDPTNSNSITFNVVFSEAIAPATFTTADITQSGTATGITWSITDSGDHRNFTLATTAITGAGTVQPSIAANTVTDVAGNNNSASTATDNTVTYDTTAPTVTVNQAGGQSDPVNSLPINFTVVFSEAISAATFTTADITQNGSATGITWSISDSGDHTTFTLAATAITGAGTVQPSIAANRVTDPAGNNNTASTATDNTVTYSTTGPSVTVNQAGGQSDPINTLPINFTVVFSSAVNAATFTTADITQNGTATGITWSITDSGDHTTFTLAATAITGAGTVQPSIAANSVQDNSTNNNQASTATDNTVTYDTTAPTVTVNQAGGQSDPINSLPINFTVVFSEAISAATFTTADITQNGTATGITWSITDSGDHTTFTLSATAITGAGTVQPSIAANTVTDVAGNNNSASTATDNTVTYDTTAPTVTVNQAGGQSDPVNSLPINFTVVFSEAISAATFTTADITQNGSATGITWSITDSGDHTTFTLSATAITGEGTLQPSIAVNRVTDPAGNNNTASTATDNTVTYDITAPATPTSITLNTPASSPSTTLQPTFTVSGGGVANGFTVKLFESNTCALAALKKSATSAGTSLNMQISSAYTSGGSNDGGHDMYATVTDSAGNESACSTAHFNYVLDTVAPAIAITTPTNNSYINIANNSTTFAVNGTCTDASPSGGVNTNTAVVWIDGSAVTTTGGVCNGTTFSSTINTTGLSAGAHTVLVKFTDNAGNQQTSSSISVTKDVTAPTVTITSPVNSLWISSANQASITVSGTCSSTESGRTVTVQITDGTTTVNPGSHPSCTTGNPNWTTTVNTTTLSEGTANIIVKADLSDLAGNNATQATVTLAGKDITAPIANSLTLSDAEGYTDSTNSLSITATLSTSDATSGVGNQCVAEGTDCSGCSYTGSYAGTASIDLANTTVEQKTVSYKVKDVAGNESSCTSGTIYYEDVSVHWKYQNRNRIVTNSAWGSMKNGTPNTDDCSNDYNDNPTQLGCIHAGLMRRVIVPTALFNSCDDASAVDDLGIYDWLCSYDSKLEKVVFDATFKPGKGLGHFIDPGEEKSPGTFKNNKITITKNAGANTYVSYSRDWWFNDRITAAPDTTSSTADLSDDTLYVIKSDLASYGFQILGSHSALIALPNIVVTQTSNKNSCNYGGGLCLIFMVGVKNYIEGTFNGSNNTDSIIDMKDSSLNHFNKLYLVNSKDVGIKLYNSNGNYIENSKIEYIEGTGSLAYIENSNGSVLNNVVIGNSKWGIRTTNVKDSTFSNVTVHNTQYAEYIDPNPQPSAGAQADDQNNYFVQFTNMANSTNLTSPVLDGFFYNYNFHNLLNIGSNGFDRDFDLLYYQSSTASQIASKGVYNMSTYANDIKFTGNLILENTTVTNGNRCKDNNSPNSSVIKNGSVCENTGESDANIVHDIDFYATALAHSVMTSDGTNTEIMNSGISTNTGDKIDSNNWFNFDYWQNFWSYPNGGNTNAADYGYIGNCDHNTLCQILNNILSTADSTIFNRSDKVTSTNNAFVANATCPTEVNGDNAIRSHSNTNLTYLKNAVEIVNTGGNNNGLCETNETCLYTPNIGSYQGHGNLQRCDFDDNSGAARITNVKMYGWSSNGI